MYLPFLKKGNGEEISFPVAVAVFLAAASLAAAGVALYIAAGPVLEEQIALRREFMELKGQQEQVNIQYEAWLKKAKKEINAAQAIEDAASAPKE